MSVGLLFFIGDPEATVFCDHFVWRDLIFAFDLDFYVIVDYTKNNDYKGYGDEYKECYSITDIKTVKKIKPKHKTVLVSQGGKNIINYNHPKENVIYIIGKDTVEKQNIDSDDKIGIYYPNQKRELWAIQAASIVLYDRLVKLK